VSPALRDRWERFGRVGALPVVAVTFAVLFVVVLLLDNPARRAVGCVLIAALLLHCLARPAGGARVFFLAGLPALIGTVVDDIIALPRWTALVFFPFALLLAWYEDHPDEDDEGADGPAREAAS